MIVYEVRETMMGQKCFVIYRVTHDEQGKEVEATPGPTYYFDRVQAQKNADFLNSCLLPTEVPCTNP